MMGEMNMRHTRGYTINSTAAPISTLHWITQKKLNVASQLAGNRFRRRLFVLLCLCVCDRFVHVLLYFPHVFVCVEVDARRRRASNILYSYSFSTKKMNWKNLLTVFFFYRVFPVFLYFIIVIFFCHWHIFQYCVLLGDRRPLSSPAKRTWHRLLIY